jgi:GNAT superfamily N-acetyltransferase
MDVRLAADENLAVHATWASRRLAEARVELADDLILVDSGQPCDTFNFICRARLNPANAPARIQYALRFFAESGHPFSWWLGPGATPDNIPALLVEAGLNAAESELAMALDMSQLRQGPLPDNVIIERVRTPEQLEILACLSAANWSPPDQEVVRFYRRAASHLLGGDAPQWFYLGRYQGEPVATAELTVGGGVVGLYNIFTRPDARGRGVGSAMTVQPLLDARAAGHTTAILQASAAGQSLYSRLGFRSFGTITEYKPG